MKNSYLPDLKYSQMVIHSSFPDFILFLYIHVAHIDNTYDPNEISTIKTKMKRLFPSETDLEKKLYQAIREYNKFDRSKLNELCTDTLLHFRNEGDTQKTRLFEVVEDIIKADGKVDKIETDVLRKIKELVDSED